MLTNLMFRPKASLADIYMHLYLNNNGKYGIQTRFRVRNVETLEDYGVVKVADYGSNGRPLWFQALQLDCFNRETKLRGDIDKYALLSTVDEVHGTSEWHLSYYSSMMAACYREASLAACEVQFGEG